MGDQGLHSGPVTFAMPLRCLTGCHLYANILAFQITQQD